MTAPPQVPGERPTLAHHVRAALTDHLDIKILSLMLAVPIWLLVGARTPSEGYVSVRIEPVLDSSLAMLGGPLHVRALVAGRTVDLVKLYAKPPVIRRTVSGDAPDTLMLDITPSDVHLSPEFSGQIQVLDVEPRSVMLRFETKASRLVSVVNDGRVVVRGSARDVRFEPATVRITGPRGMVRHLRALRPLALTLEPNDSIPHLADLDTAGLGIRAHPSQVRVQALGAGTP